MDSCEDRVRRCVEILDIIEPAWTKRIYPEILDPDARVDFLLTRLFGSRQSMLHKFRQQWPNDFGNTEMLVRLGLDFRRYGDPRVRDNREVARAREEWMKQFHKRHGRSN